MYLQTHFLCPTIITSPKQNATDSSPKGVQLQEVHDYTWLYINCTCKSLYSPTLKTVSQIWPHTTLTAPDIFRFSKLLASGKKEENDLDVHTHTKSVL